MKQRLVDRQRGLASFERRACCVVTSRPRDLVEELLSSRIGQNPEKESRDCHSPKTFSWPVCPLTASNSSVRVTKVERKQKPITRSTDPYFFDSLFRVLSLATGRASSDQVLFHSNEDFVIQSEALLAGLLIQFSAPFQLKIFPLFESGN